MLKSHIVLFEDFTNNPVVSKLYEDQDILEDKEELGPKDYEPLENEPYIDPIGIDYNNLSRGQKASVTKGFNLVNNMQFAACYLKAKIDLEPDQSREALGRSTPYDYSFTPTNWEQEYTAKAYAMHMGININTFSKTTTKFKNLLEVPEDPYSLITTKYENRDEAIWPGLVDLFMLFQDTSLDSIKRLVCLGYNHDINSDEELAKTKDAANIRQRDLEQLGKDIARAFKQFLKSKPSNPLGAATKAIKIGIDSKLTEKQKHAKFKQLRKAALRAAKSEFKYLESDLRAIRRAPNPYDSE